MAKTMRNVVITAILLIVLAAGACALVVTGGCSALASADPLAKLNPFTGAQVAATNALIDSSGIKDRVESELYSHVGQISAATGIPAEMVKAGIDDLSIHDWQAVEKPANAKTMETGSYSVNADGTQVDVTTYDDPGIVTVEVHGQEVTLAVPESAQQYADYIPLLDYLP